MRIPPHKKSRRLGRTLVECTAVVLFVLSSTAAAKAFTPDVAEQVEHFWTCFGLMITDPATHVIECGPGHFPPDELKGNSGVGFPSKETTTTTAIDQSTTTIVTTTVDTTTSTAGS